MTPTPFCMKLRKHLRGLRMEQLVQISTDRVIFIQCGVGHYKHTIIMELYAKGNLIITDATYTVIALLRSHIYTASNGNTEPTAVTATSSHPSNSPTTNINSNNNNNHNHAVLVQVGQVYPVSYATSIGTSSSLKTTTKDEVVMDDVTTTLEPTTLLNVPSATEFNQWIREYIETIVQQNSTVAMNAKKKKKSNIITLKMVLSQNNNNNNNNSSSNHHHHPYQNDVHHYGPALIEHCIRTAQLNPNQPLILTKTTNLPDTTTSSSTIHIHQYTNEEWERLRKSLREEGTRILQCLHDGTSSTGYILYRPMISISPDKCSTASPQADASTIIHDTTTMETFDFSDKILMEFQPILLAQHRNMQYIQFQNFALAVEIYFDHMAEQRNTIKAMNAERAALTKLEKVRLDQQVRIESLYEQQNLYEQQAFTIQYHAEDVDKAILVINSAITSGMSWDQIEQIVKVEQQQNQNPIALLIHQLDFENNAMILRLPRDTNHYDDEDDDIDNNASNGKRTDATTIDVRVLLHESAYANSNRLFAQYRAYKDKSMKTIEASSKAYKAAEETAKRQLLEAQKRKQQSGNHGMTMIGKRKVGWYEKFHWFITSDNYLVIGGRDAQQNELLVKRYLRNGDAYLHADVHGASSCILRAKRRRNVQDSTKTEIIPLSEQALREAGNFTICHSNAWSSRIITSAWWVEAHQVSKTAPTGEYLTVGSFMIRGKKNFLPPSPLEMGIGVLFRLGDDESILRHQNERRDFALLNDPDDVDVVQVKLPHLMVHEDQLSPGAMSMDQNESTSNVMNMDVNTPIEAVDADSAKTEGLEHQNDQEIDDDVEDLTVATKNVEIMEEDNLNEVPQNGTIDSANVDEADNVDDENPAADMDRQQHQKRGLSVRDRKLIKKYGSLEAAEKILASQQPQQNEKNSEPVDKTSSETTSLSTQKQAALKRGQKAKLKRVERKYMDQDEEDRTLAMLALQGGEKQKKKATKQNGKNKGIISENQQKVAAETVALLVKDTALVVDKLSDDVKSILAECVTVPQTVPAKDDSAEEVVHWDKFDADTLEQLLSLTPVEAQVAASTRLLNLKKSTRIDNFSASLSGIIRTIRKHGYENMELAVDPSTEVTSNKRKTKEEKDREAAKWKDALDDEGILDGDIDKDAIDDTVEISKLTGKPHIDDLLLYAIPVCGPYQSLSQYTYRVKLTPGSMKRGKSSKQCLDILSKAPNTANTGTEKYIELIKKVAENDWVQTICADVKISAPGASKATKQNKANIKKSK
jgi:predicted ribosome quality control (RQC) complex YloA/Tae2 family protein